MDLGKFSLSLAVKDIQASRAFYERLGFEVIDGQFNYEGKFTMKEGQDWLMLRHGNVYLGLFQGMFDKNTLTFNPKDARSIQANLKKHGVPLLIEADETGSGPASLMLTDPDGNPILIDQH